MTNRFAIYRLRLSTLLCVLVCLVGIGCAEAQTAAFAQAPIVVGRKRAFHLMISQVRPVDPALAKVNYIQGRVRVELTVSRQGRVTHAHVLRGHPILAASALKAVRRWLFHPLMTPSGPATFLTTVSMNFSLQLPRPDLLPPRAEDDLKRQVKPPEVLARPLGQFSALYQTVQGSASSVRLRVLLDEEGKVIDSEPLKGPASEFEEAQKEVEHWTFRPARWGTLSVPWYLEMDVPVPERVPHSPVAGRGGR